MDARTAIFTPILLIHIFNTLRELFVIPFPFTFPPIMPIVVAIFGDVQDLAQTKNRKELAMFRDKLKFHGWGYAKMLTAFFNISLSCRNISFSRFNFLISSSIAI
jgi:hypothetical protein